MAAAPEFGVLDLIELKHLRSDELEPVLEEEQLSWRSVLNWDFSASAELVRRFIRIQALSGHALIIGGRIAGYGYYVCEDRKGLIGDLYVLRDFATKEAEDFLLSAVLQSLVAMPYVRRIESQLMMLHGPFERTMPLASWMQTYPRIFMLADLSGPGRLPEGAGAGQLRIEPWSEKEQEESAHLIAAAYHGHIDSKINDQYKSYAGAKRFLTNIVQYPGCGSFFGPASLAAYDVNGRLCGIVLSSLVASDVGHITQICVAPEVQGQGVGYELLRQSMRILGEHGCERTSLTVTASNQTAVRLYQSMGFRAMRRFAAYVWEGF
jgi:ribosomal protein S18 acetylase RimI-like enzyme